MVKISFDVAVTMLAMGPGILIVSWCFSGWMHCFVVDRLRHEAQNRLATPLNRVLAGSGWSAQAMLHTSRYDTPPAGLEGPVYLCAPGYLYLEFTNDQSAEAQLLNP